MGDRHAAADHPAPFVKDTLAFIRKLMETKDEDDFELEYMKMFVPRLISRFSRADIPEEILAALDDANPAVVTAVAQDLGLGGNPDAVDALKRTAAERTDDVRTAAEWALKQLGAR